MLFLKGKLFFFKLLYITNTNAKYIKYFFLRILTLLLKCSLAEEHRIPLINILEKYAKSRDEILCEIAKKSLKNCI